MQEGFKRIKAVSPRIGKNRVFVNNTTRVSYTSVAVYSTDLPFVNYFFIVYWAIFSRSSFINVSCKQICVHHITMSTRGFSGDKRLQFSKHWIYLWKKWKGYHVDDILNVLINIGYHTWIWQWIILCNFMTFISNNSQIYF